MWSHKKKVNNRDWIDNISLHLGLLCCHTIKRMIKIKEKPAPEAKALSLFLMAFKSKNPIYKEKSKRMNRIWGLVTKDEMSKEDYMAEVQATLTSYGGYAEVIEKTVRHYIKKSGEWTLSGDDQYCKDAQAVADKILKK